MTVLTVFSVVSIADLDEEIVDSLDAIQDLINSTAGSQGNVGQTTFRSTDTAGNRYDADGDGRLDAYWVTTTAGTQAVCFFLQLDFIFDKDYGNGKAAADSRLTKPEADPTVEDEPFFEASIMQYALSQRTGTGATGNTCVSNAPPTPTITVNRGMVQTKSTPTLPTYLNVYFGTASPTLNHRIEVFSRSEGRNAGIHVVSRDYVRSASLSPAYPGPNYPHQIDLTNLHILSGRPQPQFHDFDDDNYTDIDELSAYPSNPFNKRSTPLNFDGDVAGNCPKPGETCPDEYETDDTRFRNFGWDIAITEPLQDAVDADGSVLIAWTATPKPGIVNPTPLKEFDLLIKRGYISGTTTGRCPGPNSEHDSDSEWPTKGSSDYEPEEPITAALPGPDGVVRQSTVWVTDDGVGRRDEMDAGWCIFLRARDNPTSGPALKGLPHARRFVTVANDPAPPLPAVTAQVTKVNPAAILDDPNQLSGDVRLTFTATATRGGTLNYTKLEVRPLCPGSASYVEVGDEADVGTNLTSPVHRDIVLSKSVLNSLGIEDGHICGPVSGSIVSPYDLDVAFRITVDETPAATADERDNDDLDLPPRLHVVNFDYFNNVLPTVAAGPVRTLPADDGALPSEYTDADTTTTGTKARFQASVTDPDTICAGNSALTLFIRPQGATAFQQAPMALKTQKSLVGRVQETALPPTSNCFSVTTQTFDVDVKLDPGTYEYYYEAVDNFQNRQSAIGQPVRHPAGTGFLEFTQVDPTTKKVNDLLSMVPCLQEADPANCYVRLVEDSQSCDVQQLGGSEYETTCTAKATEDAVGTAEDVLGLLQQTLEDIIATASRLQVGPPNPYVILRCSGVTAPDEVEQVQPLHGCEEDDTDRDGFTDAEENGLSDPTNPYSNPLDRDADLVLDALELYLDVNTHRVNWVDGEGNHCTAESSQFYCFGQVEILPAGSRHVNVWAPSTSNLAQRSSLVVGIRDGTGNPAYAQIASDTAGASWTVFSGLLTGPSHSNCAPATFRNCAIQGRINAADNEGGVDFRLSLNAGAPVLDLKLLGGPKTGTVRTLLVTTDPVMVNLNGVAHNDAVDGAGSQNLLGQATNCSTEPTSGSWLRLERRPDGTLWLCGRVRQGSVNQPISQQLANPPRTPTIGLHPDGNGGYIVWMDRATGERPLNREYDEGEELTSGGSPGVDPNDLCQDEGEFPDCMASPPCDVGNPTSCAQPPQDGCFGAANKPKCVQDTVQAELDKRCPANTPEGTQWPACAIPPLPLDAVPCGATPTAACFEKYLAGRLCDPTYTSLTACAQSKLGSVPNVYDLDGDGYPNTVELAPSIGYRSNPLDRCSTPMSQERSWMPGDPPKSC